MATDLTTAADRAAIIERVVVTGDLSKLTPQERVNYYQATCDSLGLNPLTKPFEYISLNGKLTLYATRTATDQLRSLKAVSIEPTRRELIADAGIYIVEVKAHTSDGRCDFASGVVNVANLKSDPLANAMMKAETKAKRRATLSICGLGWMDETETETVPAATRVAVDHSTGEVVSTLNKPPQPSKESARRADAWRAIEESEKPADLLHAAATIRDDKLIPDRPKAELLEVARDRMWNFAQRTVKAVATPDAAEKSAKWYGQSWLLTGEQKTQIVAALGGVRESLLEELSKQTLHPAGAGEEEPVAAAAS